MIVPGKTDRIIPSDNARSIQQPDRDFAVLRQRESRSNAPACNAADDMLCISERDMSDRSAERTIDSFQQIIGEVKLWSAGSLSTVSQRLRLFRDSEEIRL